MAGVMGDINNNLMGLQQLAMGRQQIQQNEELASNNKVATENLRKYYASEQAGNPDYSALQEAFLRSPDLSQRMLQGSGITDKRKGQDAASYAIEAYGAIDDPERFVDLTQKRIQYLQDQGRDASQSIGALEAYMSGKKEQVRNGTKLLLASLTNQGHVDKDVYSSLAGAKNAEGFSLSEGQTRFDAQGNKIASVGKTYNPNAPENRPTANSQDLATYKRMKAAGDPDAEGFGRAIGIISKEGEKLSSLAEKLIADAADAANVSQSSAAKYTSLADNLRNATKMSGGLKGSWGEWIKEQTGSQDELTALRKEALGIANSEAIANLPPGPATDRDIEMAKAPFPTEKSDPKYVADWLSAVARLQQKKAEYAEFKADFISKNGTLRGDGKSLSAAWKESQKQAAPVSRFKIEVSD